MRLTAFTAALGLFLAGASALDKPLDIEKTHEVGCDTKDQTKEGDKVKMHYRGTLESDGSEFDASYNRGTPLDFTVGKGQVIKGWDQGLLGMCVGDKRKLTIQPEFGYGSRSMGPIPANSVLIFETELVSINGKGAPPPAKAEI